MGTVRGRDRRPARQCRAKARSSQADTNQLPLLPRSISRRPLRLGGETLRPSPATLLILLSTSARTRIVATNLVSRPYHLLYLHIAGTRHARLFQLLLFLALE